MYTDKLYVYKASILISKSIKKYLTYNILKHIALWAIYLIFPLVITPSPKPEIHIVSTQWRLFIYFLSSFYSILFFYTNFFWAIPRLAYSQKKWKYCVVVLLFVSICFALNGILSAVFPYASDKLLMLQLLGALLRLLFVGIVAWILFLYKRNQEYVLSKNEHELASLKAQVNPHFLFNVLNSLYALALKKSDNLADAISKTSDMMRYNIEESKKRFVSLEQELRYIQDYVAIQQLRLTSRTKVTCNIKGDFSGRHIEPLLVIAFIENAFKYGVSTEKESNIVLDIEMDGDVFKLTIYNDKVRLVSDTIGTGIENTVKRLNYTYNGQYELVISDMEHHYTVNLSIRIP